MDNWHATSRLTLNWGFATTGCRTCMRSSIRRRTLFLAVQPGQCGDVLHDGGVVHFGHAAGLLGGESGVRQPDQCTSGVYLNGIARPNVNGFRGD